MRADLMVLSVGGVQRFIAESRKTEDVAGASWLVRDLAVAAATVVRDRLTGFEIPLGLVFPTPDALDSARPDGVTSKVTALVPEGDGPATGRAAAQAAVDRWSEAVRSAGLPADASPPGRPDIVWVSVSGDTDNYSALWRDVQAALVNRRRTRWFQPVAWRGAKLCAQTPSLPAQPAPGLAYRVERKEALSGIGWVKRLHGRQLTRQAEQATFPSTTVIASAPYRHALVRLAERDPDTRAELASFVRELDIVLDHFGDDRRHRALPGAVDDGLRSLSDRLGMVISPDAWEPEALRAEYGDDISAELIDRGQRTAVRLRQFARVHGVRALTPYYAIIVQDLDHLGVTVGNLALAGQRQASGALLNLARAQRDRATGALAVPIYAGGDDFLAFSPASGALSLAAQLRTAVDGHTADGPLDGLTASTAVVFAHMTGRLRETISVAQSALTAAKDARGRGGRQRDALTVVVLRRAGERARTIVPWRLTAAGGTTSATDLLTLATPAESGLSARLAAKLEQDREQLDSLAELPATWPVLRRELARLVERQGGTPEVAQALYVLGLDERSVPGRAFQPIPAALVARFLGQECTDTTEPAQATI